MTVNVKIDNEDTDLDPSGEVKVNISPTIKVNIKQEIIAKFGLDARETLSGDVMIFDHKDIDIMILKDKKKVIAFAKELMSDAVYGASNRLMKHLKNKGVIEYDSVQGGNVYGSLEAKLLEPKKLNLINVLLTMVGEWMESERPYFEAAENYEEEIEDYYADPDEDDTTPLGKVPQKAEKGSIRYGSYFSPYYYGAYLYENKNSEDK